MLTLMGGRAEIEMTERDAELLAAIVPTLAKLRLSLFCERCYKLGNHDGVRAANGLDDPTWVVECGCTTRVRRRRAS